MVTILYCPFAKNNSCSATFDPGYCRENEYCNVANFNYTKEQAETLVNHMRCNLNS